MSDYAHEWTNEQIEKLEKKIESVYGNAAEEISKVIDDYFKKFEKRDAKKLQELKDGIITEEEYKQWRLAQMGRGERFKALRDKLAERMTEANEVAMQYINDATPSVYALNRNYAAYSIESLLADSVAFFDVANKHLSVVMGLDFTLFDESTVRRLITLEPDTMPYYPPEKAVKRGIDLAFGKQKITEIITSGIIRGESIEKLAKELKEKLVDMDMVAARRAVRTAMTCAQNAGRMDSYIDYSRKGIIVEKEWMSANDLRVRDSHRELNGVRVRFDEKFPNGLMFPSDPEGAAGEVYNCRCTMRGVLPEMADAKRTDNTVESYLKWVEEKKNERDNRRKNRTSS